MTSPRVQDKNQKGDLGKEECMESKFNNFSCGVASGIKSIAPCWIFKFFGWIAMKLKYHLAMDYIFSNLVGGSRDFMFYDQQGVA